MTHDLRDALRAEYELAHETIRPDGVAAVHATATRNRNRAVAGTAALAVALAVGAAAWRLAPGDEPPQLVGGGCDRPGVDVAVFLRHDATEEQTAEVDRALRDSPEVYCLVHETREAAWERFKRQFSDAPDLVGATKADSLPASFRFRVAEAAESDTVEQKVRDLSMVTDYICSCRTGPS